jgi:hypothetical protein
MVCKIMVLRYLGKSCFGRGPMLESSLGVQRQIMSMFGQVEFGPNGPNANEHIVVVVRLEQFQ